MPENQATAVFEVTAFVTNEQLLVDQAVVEAGTTFVRNLSDYSFWVAFLLVITNCDTKQVGENMGVKSYGLKRLTSA